jgi:glycosyltransferase involved in cell wall biosynthesis
MLNNQTKIIVGLPAYNEEQNIGSVIANLKKSGYAVIVCNDGSKDATELIANEMGAVVINHVKNLGYGAAIRSIFEKFKELDYDILVTFDSDGQHRVSDISKVLEPIINNQADIVIGSRFIGKQDTKLPRYRKIGIKVLTNLVNSETRKDITDSQSGFRAYNKKIIESLNLSDTGMGVSTEILIKANQAKFRIAEVPITILYDGDTSTHNPISHGTSVFLSTMKFISIEHPLKFYGIPGLIFLIIGLGFIVWTIQEFTETRRIITNISLIGIGSTILGVMFMMTSIMLYSLVNVVRERR